MRSQRTDYQSAIVCTAADRKHRGRGRWSASPLSDAGEQRNRRTNWRTTSCRRVSRHEPPAFRPADSVQEPIGFREKNEV